MGGFKAMMILVFGLGFYVCWHLWRITPAGWQPKLAVTGLFMLWMAIEFTGFFYLERVPVKLAAVWYVVGNTWLIAFLYLLLMFVLADMASLFHLIPKSFLKDSAAGLATFAGLVALLLTAGGVHYRHKYREELTITTGKALEKPLTVVLASDLHVSYHNGKAELARWVELINAENPDLVLFGGDVFDRSMRPVVEGNYAEVFRRIKAPVWTVFGNHEYYCDVNRVEPVLKDAGICLLRDSTAHFMGVDIIGRNDRVAGNRKSLAELTAGLDGFTIVLDHQPYHLEEAEEAGVDFQFSGHTHHGQVWPASWLTDAMYEKAWGHHRRGNTRYYVSSGLGIWGPRIRIGTRSEYLVLHLRPSP